MSGPDQAPGAALAHRWRGVADIVCTEGMPWVAVMRIPGCPPPAIVLAEDEQQLENRLTRQVTEGERT